MIQLQQAHHGPVQSFRFERSLLNRFAMVPVHSYVVDGLLVDTNMPHARPYLPACWDGLGLQQAILTHYHEDHSGNAAWVQDRYQLPVYASPDTVAKVGAGVNILFYQRLAFGQPDRAVLLPRENVLETSQYRFELIPTPGHTADHICLYEASQGWLFSGDLFVGEKVRLFKKGENVWQQIASLETVLQREIQSLFCAHSPRWEQGDVALERKLDFMRTFTQSVLYYHQKGLPYGQILREMQLRERWGWRLLTGGDVSLRNMMDSVFEDM